MTSVFKTKEVNSFLNSLKNNSKLIVVSVIPFSDSAGLGPAFFPYCDYQTEYLPYFEFLEKRKEADLWRINNLILL